ncbi:MAG: hypothetical protein R3195_11575 [Gemmatimonadota bacterium]|nr:hypothetical protein [Gemmatimonadota bacterium]
MLTGLLILGVRVAAGEAQNDARPGRFDIAAGVGWLWLDSGTASAPANSTPTFDARLAMRPGGYSWPATIALGYSFAPSGGDLGDGPRIHRVGVDLGLRVIDTMGESAAFGAVLELGPSLVDFAPPDVDPDACRPEDGCLFEGITYEPETVGAGQLGALVEVLFARRWLFHVGGGALWLPWGENAQRTGHVKPWLFARLGLML